MDPQLWAFLVVATLLAVTPGADTLLVARNVLGRGRTAGLATIAGIAAGCFVHATLSAVGVSLILVRSAEAFHALKWGGAAYLILLGTQSIRGWWRADAVTPAPVAAPAGRTGARRLRSFMEGLLTNALNPKVALFYLGVAWLSLLSVSLVRIRPLVESRLWRARLEGASGAVLVALGVRLAAERR